MSILECFLNAAAIVPILSACPAVSHRFCEVPHMVRQWFHVSGII
jgi:hypothetical protein